MCRYLLFGPSRTPDGDEYHPSKTSSLITIRFPSWFCLVEEIMSVVQLVLEHFMPAEDASAFRSRILPGRSILKALEKAYLS